MAEGKVLTRTFSILLLSLLVSSGSAGAALTGARIQNLDRFFRQQIESHPITSLNIAVAYGKQIVWSGIYGVKDLDTQDAIDSETLFHQGSISETVTLATFMHLWESENLNLDSDINTLLPFPIRHPDYPDAPITFRMLITHTAGFNEISPLAYPCEMSETRTDPDFQEIQTLEEFLMSCLCPGGEFYSRNMFCRSLPGSQYNHSHLDYALLGYLVELVSGEPFHRYCRRCILDPLVMSQSTFLTPGSDLKNSACRYYMDAQAPLQVTKVPLSSCPAYMSCNFYTRSREYLNFLMMLAHRGTFAGRRVLSENTVNTMLKIQNLPADGQDCLFKPIGQALLWNVSEVDAVQFYHLCSSQPGGFSEVLFSPDYNTAAIIFLTGEYSSDLEMRRFMSEASKHILSLIQGN